MLNDKEIRALILIRGRAAMESCNSYHINHVIGQVRGLIAALVSGPPPQIDSLQDVCDYVKIPYEMKDGSLWFDDDWLMDHGFIIENGDFYYNDRSFGRW